MWETLSSAIVDTIRTSDKVQSAAVYDYRKSTFDLFPTITVYAADNVETSFRDTNRNQRSYVFSIRCYQERITKGEDTAESIMRNLIDSLISIFDNDPYLNNAVRGRGFCKPIPSSWALVQGEDVDTLMAEILLEVVVAQ